MARDWTKTTFGERLRYAMDLRGLGQNEVGAPLKITSGEMSKLVHSTQLVAGTRKVGPLATRLDVPPEWLGRGEGSPDRLVGGGDVAADPVTERAPVIAMARCLREEVDEFVLEAAMNAFRVRAFASDTTRADLETAFLEELARAHQLRLSARAIMADTEVQPCKVGRGSR